MAGGVLERSSSSSSSSSPSEVVVVVVECLVGRAEPDETPVATPTAVAVFECCLSE